MSAADTAQRFMKAYGEAMVLKRQGQADLPLQGKRLMKSRTGGHGEFSNSAAETDLYVRIGNNEIVAAAWPGPPAIGDIILFGGRNYSITHVDTRVHAGVTVVHFMFVAG